MVGRRGRRLGRIAQAVLVAQVLFDDGKDLVDGHAPRHLEEPGAGIAGELLHHALAVGTHDAAAAPAEAADAVHRRIGEQDRVDQSVGALRGFDGPEERRAAAVILAVAEENEGLPSLLLAHDLVGAEKNGIVELSSAAASTRPPAAAGVASAARVATSPAGV